MVYLPPLAAGTHNLTVIYSGDADRSAGSTTLQLVVEPAASELTLASSGQQAAAGAPLTLRATVSPDGWWSNFYSEQGGFSGPPSTGTVTFYSDGVAIGTADVVDGVATLTTSGLPLGTSSITASYSGDANYQSAAVPDYWPLTQQVTANPVTTYTAASAAPSAPVYGTPVVLTARPTGQGNPQSGTVSFYEGAVLLGTANLVNGTATLTLNSLEVGSHSIQTVYSGDANNAASTGYAYFTVQKAPAPLTSQTPPTIDEHGTLSVQVDGVQPGPGGLVSFYIGTRLLGTAQVVNGVATLSGVPLPAGTFTITAAYTGDAHHLDSEVSFIQTIQGDPSTLIVAELDNAQDRTTVRLYDRDGQLQGVLDAEGYLTEYTYDAAGRLARTLQYANRAANFADEATRTAAVAVARASYNLAGLRPSTNGADISTYNFYDAQDRLVGQVDGEGYLTETVYDLRGNVAQTRRYANKAVNPGAAGATLASIRPSLNAAQDQTVTQIWSAANLLISRTNAEGTVTQYAYDSVGHLVKAVVAAGTGEARTSRFMYDLQGRLTGELDGRGTLAVGASTDLGQWQANGTTHTYDAAGRRTSTTDANGQRTLFFYDGAGRLAYTVNALGEATENRYSAHGQLTEQIVYGSRINVAALAALTPGELDTSAIAAQLAAMADAAKDTRVQHDYTAVGTEASTTDALGQVTDYSYNAFREAIASTYALASGQVVTDTAGYDRRGLRTVTTRDASALALAERATYDAFGRVVEQYDGNNNRTRFAYDRLGRVVTTIDPLGGYRYATYDAFDRVLTQRDALGYTTTYSYSTANRSVTVTTPEGVAVTTVRTRHGQTQSVADGRGNTTTYTYDASGNLVQTSQPLGVTTTAEYDKTNLLIKTTDARGIETVYAYDAARRLATRTLDPAGLNLVTTYAYDAKGQGVAVTDARGVVTTTDFDLAGQAIRQTVDPTGLNLQTVYTYDATGQVLTVTDPNGHLTRYTYDGAGRRVRQQVDPDGLNLTTAYEYDANDNVTRVIDANGNATRYAYDANDQRVFSVDAMGGVARTEYDQEGRIVRTTAYATPLAAADLAALGDAPGVAAIQAKVAANAAADVTQARRYDRDGRLRFTVDGTGAVVEYKYDKNNNVIETRAYANRISLAVWNLAVDPPVVADASRDERVRTVYDALDRAAWQVDGAGGVTGYAYDANGNVIDQRAYANALAGGAFASWNGTSAPPVAADASRDQRVRTVYDNANRAVWSVDALGGVSSAAYDAVGNVIDRRSYATALDAASLAAWDGATPPPAVADDARDAHVRQVFDAASRLTWSVDGTGAVTRLAYDANGNVIRRQQYAGAIAPGADPWTAVASDDDRAVDYLYDAAGRMAYQLRWTNSSDLMSGVGPMREVTSYAYDGVGRLVRQTQHAWPLMSYVGGDIDAVFGNLSVAPGLDRSSFMVYDAAGRLAWSVDGVGAVTQNRYDGTGTLTGTIQYANPVDVLDWSGVANGYDIPPLDAPQLQGMLLPDASRDRVTAMAHDTAGRTTFTVDALGGVSRTVYDAFGNVTLQAGYANRIAAPTDASVYTDAGLRASIVADASADRVQRLAWDQAGRQVFSVDALGAAVETSYDGLGQAVQTRRYARAIGTDGLSPTASVADIRARVVADAASDRIDRHAYDAAGREVYGVDAYGYVTASTYDALGQRTGTTLHALAIPAATANSASAIGAAIVADAADRTTTHAYDAAGRVLATTDALGFTESWSYDALGNKSAYTNANGATWTYGYDRTGRMLWESSPAVEITDVWPDGQGRLQTQTYTGSVVTQMVYDAFGNLRQRIEQQAHADQRITEYAYDQLGRQVMVIYPATQVDTGQDPSSGQRTDTWQSKVVATHYDALGNAVVNDEFARDQATGAYVYDDRRLTYKTYDRLGRVAYEVDAEGHVTGYERNTFGDATVLTRHGQAIALPAQPQWPQDPVAPTTAQVGAATASLDHGADRVLHTTFDRLGRAIEVKEPQAFVYDSSLGVGNAGSTQGKTTRNTYDTFGDLVQVARLKGAGTWVLDTRYFDRRGQQVASVDALGHLTARNYDAAGNLVEHVEYANALAGWAGTGSLAGWSGLVNAAAGTAPAPGAPAPEDRRTSYGYDLLNRKTSETRVDVEFSTASNGTSQRGNLTTTYGYDAVGNLTRTTAPLGASTYSWYDALGRVVAVAGPEVYDVGLEIGRTPLTVYRHDAYGNVVATTEYVNGAAWDGVPLPWAAAPNPMPETVAVPNPEIATLAGLGYVQETSPGYISADAFPGSKPIYRLYSNNPLVPVHFYTDSAAERDALVATGIWRSEGVAGHLAAAQAPGTVPLYKIQIASAWSWSGLSAYYVYTSDETERQQLLSQPGAVDWGAMGYVATQPGEAMHTQLARYYNPATSDHFYTPATIDLPPDPERDADLYASTDRTTLAMYDANGNVVQSTDAMGVQHLSSYTVHGQLAREWQSVTGNDGGTSTGTSVLWRAYDYDRLGQQTHVYEPGTATDNASFVGGAATAPGVYSARPGASVQQGSFGPYPDSEPGTPDPGGEPPAQTYGKLTLGNLVNLLAGAGAFQVEFDYLTPDYEVTTPGDENNPPTTTSGHGSYTHVSPLQPASAAGMPVDFVPAHPLGSVQQIRIYSVAAGGARTLVWSGSVEQADGQTTLDLGNNAGAAPVDTALAYNAFGELVGRSVNGQAVEYFDYDNAGRLWRTNAGDGVDRVALYDALGNQTAQIGSAGAGRADMNLRHVGDAAQVAGFKDVRRTDTTYDLLGRVVSQAGPERLETQGGAGVRTDALAGGIASRASHDGQGWSGINTVNLSWNMTSGLGSGDVLVRVIYASIDENGNPGPERVVTRIFNATQAQGGASISWNTNDAQQQDRLGSITRIEVHKKDVNANWVQLASQGFGDVGQALLVDAPDNPQSTTVVQYRVAGSGGTWAQLPAVHFGEQLRADLGGLPLGTYEYQAVTTTVGQAPVTAAAGTFSITPKPLAGFTVDGVDPGSQTLQWQGPGAGDSQVIRVRTGGGAWVQLPIVRDGGDYSRVDLSGLGAGTYEYEILWTRPGESGPYAHASGQFTKVAGVPGTPEVPPSGLPHIGGIALETRTETQTLGTDESGNPITATRQVTVMKLPPPPAGQVSALLLHIKGDGAPLVPMIITARADGWWEFNLTDSGWMPFVGVYEYAYGYSPGLGQPAVAHAIGDLGKGLASPGPGYTFSLADTTPPYVPGTPATPGTPAQYAWSATDAGPYAISQDPLLGGRAISLAAGLNGLNAWQRPVVNQNVDRWGNVVAISDPRSAGWVTTYRYNANDQIVEQRQPDADGNAGAASPVTRLYYDAMGRQVAVRDANGHVNGQAWDAGGHLVRELHADGGVISHAYDAFGNRTLSIDALGHGTWYTHDKLDRLVKTTRAAVDIWGWPTPQLPLAPSALIGHGQTVETQRFDEAGRLRSQTNGAGETIRYEYDLRGNLVKTTLPMGQETVAGYDALNRKTIEMDANGAVAAWRYDAFGRLAGHTDLGGAEYSYTYDNARQLVAQSNTRGQNQAYGYDAAGQLTGIADIAIGQTTSYRYDLSGRRIRETTVQGGVVYQDNHIAYDALGRMRWVGDSRVTLTIDYDAVGNRTRIATHVNDADAGAQPDTERFYAYDAMNRQVLVDSATADGSVLGDDGHLLTYDLNGNRTSDTRDGPHLAQVNGQWVAVGGQSTETYGYDAQGRLVSTVRDGVLVDARGYDQAGRLINSSPGGLPEGYAAAHSQAQGVTGLDPLAWRQSRYDANGRVVWQTALTFLNPLTTPGGQSYTGTAYEYDAAGNVTASTQADVGGGALTRTVNTIERAEGYRQAMSQTVSAVVAGGGGGASLGGVGYAHDVNGHLTHVGDAGDMSVTRSHFFVNDVNGTALYGYYGDPANPQQGQRQLVVNGEVLGRYGWVPDERYAGLDFPVPGFTPFKQTAEFGFGYQPINGNYPSGSPGSYAVGEGDTLQGIAKGAYGDSSLWYLIADANGLTGNADLRVGQVLTIPVHVSSANNSGSFQPYDPSRIIQDNGPTMMALPSDQGGGCGGVGQVIVAVVAVVVAAFTQQWYLVNVSGISGGIAGAVSAGAYGSLAVSGAVAGAAGSVASQGVGMAIGTQDSFSWEGVAMGAIGGAVGGALAGSGVLPNTGSTFANAAIRGAVGNTITQGIAVATGLQSKFDWKGVAASALGAGVGQGLNAAMGYYPGQPGVQFDLGRSLVSGLGGAIVANVARGGKISAANIAADAFGNALGESLAGAMGQKSNTAVADADPLGDFIKQNGWASTASSYDELQAAKPGQRRSAATSSSASTSVSRPVDDTNPFRLAAGVQRVVDDGDGTVYDIDANNNVKVVIDGAPAPAAGPGQRIQLNPYQLTPGASRVVDGSGNVYDVLQDGTVRSVIDGSSQTKSESAWRTVIRPDGFDYGYVQTEADGIDINKVRTTPGAVRTSDDFGNVQDVLPNGKTRMIVSVDSPLPISQQLIINQSLQNSLTNMQDRGAEIRSWNNETAKMAFYNAFGTTETEARSVVLQRIEGNIASNQSIDISNFQYASRNANPGWTDADYNGIGAYVRRNDPSNTIYVGPSLGRGDIAQVLTHETSHWNGTGPVIPGSNPRITGTVDGYVDPKTGRIAVDATGKEIVTYGVADVRSLAPNVALYHADTFGFYVSDLIRPRTPSYGDYIGAQGNGAKR
ncbi:Ig-like domain repeat protein [Xenophilus sp.]